MTYHQSIVQKQNQWRQNCDENDPRFLIVPEDLKPRGVAIEVQRHHVMIVTWKKLIMFDLKRISQSINFNLNSHRHFYSVEKKKLNTFKYIQSNSCVNSFLMGNFSNIILRSFLHVSMTKGPSWVLFDWTNQITELKGCRWFKGW